MMTMENNGKDIVSTNFWDLPHSRDRVFFSCNDGEIRIMLPHDKKMCASIVASFLKCRFVDVVRKDAIVSVFFMDGSLDPFCIQTTPNAFDLVPALGEWTISLWGCDFGEIHKIGKSKKVNVVER